MRKTAIAIIIAATTILSSCCKEGLNGDAKVTAIIEHHEAAIYGATVYIKYNANEQPASISDYDASFTAAPGDSVIVIDNMKCGDYYFFSTGFDPAINQEVKGGTPYTIRYGDRKQAIDVKIPVTED